LPGTLSPCARPTMNVPSRLPWNWNGTADELDGFLPCDSLTQGRYVSLHRAIDVEADPASVFRWVCQLKEAPYSYDWLDNRGRRSPHTLTPGAEHLEIGQPFLIATIGSFEHDRHLSGAAIPRARRLYGVLAISYVVIPLADGSSRLLVRLNVEDDRALRRRVRRWVMAWGDLVMMRKQLLTLKQLAEQGGEWSRGRH